MAGARYHTSKTAESSGGEVALDGLCARKVNESTEIGDSGSGHPLALPHYEQEVIATLSVRE